MFGVLSLQALHSGIEHVLLSLLYCFLFCFFSVSLYIVRFSALLPIEPSKLGLGSLFCYMCIDQQVYCLKESQYSPRSLLVLFSVIIFRSTVILPQGKLLFMSSSNSNLSLSTSLVLSLTFDLSDQVHSLVLLRWFDMGLIPSNIWYPRLHICAI